jgi:hypothetical protein
MFEEYLKNDIIFFFFFNKTLNKALESNIIKHSSYTCHQFIGSNHLKEEIHIKNWHNTCH